MSHNSIYLPDESATEALGRLLAVATQPAGTEPAGLRATLGGLIFLSGELGAGKTTLTRGLMRGYGHEGAVKSPTYTLVEPYEQENCRIYHFDLYRLADPEEVEFLGVWEYFDDPNLCVVEWAEKGSGHLPGPDLELTLTTEGAGRRAAWVAFTPRGQVISHRLSEMSADSADWN